MTSRFDITKLKEKLRKLLKLKSAVTTVLALDIRDDNRLCILHAVKRGERMRVLRYEEAMLALPAVADEKAIGVALSTQLRTLRFHVGNIVFGVPRSEVMLRQMQIPFVENEGEMASMIHFQVARDLPFAPEDAVIDFSVDGTCQTVVDHTDSAAKEEESKKPQKQLQVTVAVIPKTLIHHYQEIAKAAGLKLVGLGFQSSARAEALRYCGLSQTTGKPQSDLLLTAGGETVIIDILEKGRLVFSREASLLSGADAEPRGTQITTETVRCLHSYEQDEFHSQIGAIYVMGGEGESLRLVDTLQKRTAEVGIKVEEFNPSRLLQFKNTEGQAGLSVAYLVGLASSLIERGRLSIDFLAPREPAAADSGKLKQTVWTVAAVLVVLLLFIGIRSHVLETRTAERDAVQQKLNAISKNQNTYRQGIIQALTVRSWQGAAQDNLAHLAVLSSLLPGAEDLYVTSFSTGSRSNIVLSVRARQSDVITKLDAQLREAGYRLKTPAITPVGGRSAYGFQTTMELLLPTGKQSPDLEALEPPPERPEDDISNLTARERRSLMPSRDGNSAKPVAQSAPIPTPQPAQAELGKPLVASTPPPEGINRQQRLNNRYVRQQQRGDQRDSGQQRGGQQRRGQQK